jgi:uncharacterized protein (DUF302 family)
LSDYGFGRDLDMPWDAAVASVIDALKAQGFGVLTRIDVHDVLKAKIGADIPPYVILGACNPHLASRAIASEPDVGLLLPCNVLVQAAGSGCRVSFADPRTMGSMTTNAELEPVMAEAEQRLRAVMAALAQDSDRSP